jgi:FkbM family methyltransferase
VGSYGRVYAFEPILENYEILEAVIKKARLCNVDPFHAALGSEMGERMMVIPDLEGFTGFYWAHFADTGESGRQRTVNVLTLDKLKENKKIQRLDFIKCDVEGRELEVIGGGLGLIRSQLPGWLLEVSRRASSGVFSILKNIGYRAFVYNSKLIETENYRDKEYSNYFFFHPSSHIWKRVLPLTLETQVPPLKGHA